MEYSFNTWLVYICFTRSSIYSFSTIFAKIGLKYINSITVTTLRAIIMTIIIFIIFMLEIRNITYLIYPTKIICL